MKPKEHPSSGTFFVKGEKIILKKDGTWVADGTEITHEQTRDLFFKSIQWDSENKSYFLKIGYERLDIEVEDTPYFVTTVEDKNSSVTVTLSNFTNHTVSDKELSYENNALYLNLPNGQRAKFLSAPFYELMKKLQEDQRYYYLMVDGKKVNLATK